MVEALPRILIVDDEVSLLGSLQRAAANEGFHADTVADGEEAWRRLEDETYDVVVTDLRMPQLDGPQLLAKIRDRQIATRVIVITAHATLESAIDCLRHGAVDFLVKPFEMEEFLHSISLAAQEGGNKPADPQPGNPDWARVSEAFGLTKRQIDTLKIFYRTGKNNRELAEALRISEHTVKSHMKAAFQKADVSNRAQLLKRLREFQGHTQSDIKNGLKN